jgi:hypothetical protein
MGIEISAKPGLHLGQDEEAYDESNGDRRRL